MCKKYKVEDFHNDKKVETLEEEVFPDHLLNPLFEEN